MAMNMDAMLRIKADVQGENNIRRLGNSMQGLQGQAKNAALGFNNLKGAVAGFGAAIAGSAIVGGLTAVVKKSIDAGDELFNLQAKTGIAAQALTGIGNAAKLADVDVGTLGKGLTRLNVNLVKAAEGNEDLARKFQALGVNVKGANGQVVPADQALKQIADRFADMPDGAQKAATAVALFGKSGADLIPLLNEGAASMEEFTYKVSDDFAARSDLFNDTITELGIKTQGFGLELTDALLPALQSILEVFGDLFDTDQDWTALFKVIEGVIRGIAVAIYTVIKAVDILIKNVVASVTAASQAFSGDFGAAWDTITSRVSSGIEEQKKILADLNKLAFGSAPSPGTGRRTGGRNMELDAGDGGSRGSRGSAAAEAKRAATEAERLAERRNYLTEKAITLQEQLRRSVEDTRDAFDTLGASPTERLALDRDTALTEAKRDIEDLTKSVVDLSNEVTAAGGKFDFKPFLDLLNQLGRAKAELAEGDYQQGLKDLLPSLEEYDNQIREGNLLLENRKLGIEGLTEVQKLNLQIEMLGLETLALTNPALREQIELLKQRANELDKINGKAKGKTFEEGLKEQLETVGRSLGDTLMSAMDNLISKTKDWKSFMSDALKQIGSLLLRVGLNLMAGSDGIGILSFLGFGFANGGIMTGKGPAPLKAYARGGIANSPQLAMFGEGSQPEAFVPLPDGRRIPVAMNMAPGNNDNRMQQMMGASPASSPAPTLNLKFETTKINGVEYVSKDQLEMAMAQTRRQASKDGAKRGMTMTLDKIQNSPSTRSRVGIR